MSDIDHKAAALRLLSGGRRGPLSEATDRDIQIAKVHATLHLADVVHGVAMELDYIDRKIASWTGGQ